MINLMIMSFFLMLICILLMIMNILFSLKKKNDREKLSPFECGFDPMSSPRLPFSINFYSISIIFLIFDIEIIIFLPMIYSFLMNHLFNWYQTSLIFILILIFGLYIEWNNGALSWMK